MVLQKIGCRLVQYNPVEKRDAPLGAFVHYTNEAVAQITLKKRIIYIEEAIWLGCITGSSHGSQWPRFDSTKHFGS